MTISNKPVEAAGEKINNKRANLRTAESVIGSDGIVQNRKLFERCDKCTFFNKPDNCRIVEGPVQPDQICNWIQGRTGKDDDDKKYTIDDVQAFVWGMMKKQPYQHKVMDVQLTSAGWLILIEDTADPPHYFSLSLDFHVEHTSLEHHWTQEEVDALTRTGKEMNFKPPTNYDEALELHSRGEISTKEFEPFKRAHEVERRAG